MNLVITNPAVISTEHVTSSPSGPTQHLSAQVSFVCSNLVYLRRCYYASYTPFVLVSVSRTYIDKRHVCILVTVTSVIVALYGHINLFLLLFYLNLK